MFGKVFTAVLLISCVACAKPRWAQAPLATPPDAQKPEPGQTASCELKFKSGLCLDWTWEKQPVDSEFGSLIFKTYTLENGEVIPQDLSGTAALVLWMPSMGHGSSPTTVTRIDAGTYRATRVYFVMPGAWDLHFQNKDGAKVIDEAIDSLILE